MQMFSAPWDGAWRKLTVTAFFFKRSVQDVRLPHPEQICTSDLWAKIKTFSPPFWLVLFGENTYLQISNINEYTEPLYWATNPLWWYKGHNSTLPGSFTLVSKCKVCYKSMIMNFQRIHIGKNLIHDFTSHNLSAFKNDSIALTLLCLWPSPIAARQNWFRDSTAASGWNNLTQSAPLQSSRRRNRRHPANPWLLNNPRPFHHPPRLPPEQPVSHLFSREVLESMGGMTLAASITVLTWVSPLKYDFCAESKQGKSLRAVSIALNPARCRDPLHRDTHLASHLVCWQAITHEGVRWALQCVSISILCNIKMTPGRWVKNIKSVSQSTFAFFFYPLEDEPKKPQKRSKLISQIAQVTQNRILLY